jgi:cellobiose epimerase
MLGPRAHPLLKRFIQAKNDQYKARAAPVAGLPWVGRPSAALRLYASHRSLLCYRGMTDHHLPGVAPELDGESAELVRSFVPRLGRMAKELVEFWAAHGPDLVHGGFHGFLDRRGRPTAPTDKGVIQQARHLWSFSTWYERREPTASIRALAESPYHFLVDHMCDTADGEFYYKVTRDGRAAVDPKKLLYAQAFAIYGLSTYGRVFGDREAVDRALRCFDSVDARAHDRVYSGYDQRDDIAWLVAGAQKDTNTHIHLMEAFTALLDTTGEERVRTRLGELVDVCVHKLLQSQGYVHADFETDFTPVGAPLTSYGHDLETAWLLVDACRALGEYPKDVLGGARAMGLHSAERGFDHERGGYFYAGPPGQPPMRYEKVWWVQFEALPGLWWLYRLTGDPVHLLRLDRTLSWLETGGHDHEFGGWYYAVNPNGTLAPPGDHKGELWKASYHEMRALVLTEDWMRELLEQSGR